jgi:hypothetical protein
MTLDPRLGMLEQHLKTDECLDLWLTGGLYTRVVRGKLFRCPHCARAAEAKDQAAEKQQQQQQQQQNRIASPKGKQQPVASSPKRHGTGTGQHHKNKQQQPSKGGNPVGASASSAAAAAGSSKIGEKSCRLCKGTGSVRPEAMRNIKVR